MREKLGPWLAAIFCAILSTITIVTGLGLRFATGIVDPMPIAFYSFLPMCFFFVGAYLSKLQRENRELRSRIEALTIGGEDQHSAA